MTAYINKAALTEAVRRLVEEDASVEAKILWDYEGRGMLGRTTVAVQTDSWGTFALILAVYVSIAADGKDGLAYGADDVQQYARDNSEVFREVSTDGMGRGTNVYYWSYGVEFEDE